ncbi:MAG TPA: hypothetical protein VHB02_16600 [Acidimicrobiales bacterium]|nr:hypothetical protein [Acidimicrobiales bacterium]
MQFVLTGVGPDGRSTVVDRRDLAVPDGTAPLGSLPLWQSATWPPPVPPLPADPGPPRDVRVREGEAGWRYVWFAPHSRADAHWTDTVDFDTVLSGSVTLELQHGAVDLAPGDMVVVPGVVHGWHAGPDGCVLAAFLVGLPPR